jgi:RNA polymerase I-specific transcription initiation factor RRN3
VQVQVDLEDLAEDVGEGLVQSIPDLKTHLSDEIDGEDGSDEDSDDSEDEEFDPDAQRAKDITNNVEKMDIILDMLFSYYDPIFSGTSDQARDSALDILLTQFTTIILPTYRSRHTQFLLFHFAQTSPALIDIFVGACIRFAFDKTRPAIMRQSAAAYVASFVARGIHVPSSIVRDVFDYIGSQLATYRAEYEPTCRGPDRRRYSNYYSLFQALLCIFCFRWRDLEAAPWEAADNDDIPLLDDLPHDHVWIPGIKETLSQNIFSKLNPLKVCSPAIVSEFAKIANHLGIIYVFHLLETNKRLRLSQFSSSLNLDSAYSLPERETALSGRAEESFQQLDEYFPFDPCHLPRSKRWIDGDYRVWQGIPGLHDEEEEVGDSEDDEEGEEPGTGTEEDSGREEE